MPYLSDANLRAVLTVLVVRLGGEVRITNEELYEAMMPASGVAESFFGRRWSHDETGVPAAQPHLDRARREVAGDLVRGRRQGLQQHQPGRRVERRGEALSECASIIAPGRMRAIAASLSA